MVTPAVSATAPRDLQRIGGAARGETVARSLVALTKPRLATLSVLTTAIAYVAARPAANGREITALLIGTALSAGGALALNQWLERDTDCIMERTRDRPIPAGQVTPAIAFLWGASLAIMGVALLALAVNAPAAAWSAATIVLYVFGYTPLKKYTHWATEIGAIPGALPPLIGWAAAEGRISLLGWLLFALLFFWQMPHFYAIGWICRREYRAAGFPLLPAIDQTGARTAGWSLAHAIALLGVSLAPWALGFTGAIYGVVALAGGGGMAWRAWQFVAAKCDRDAAARRLFLASLGYLPLVLGALMIDRWIR